MDFHVVYWAWPKDPKHELLAKNGWQCLPSLKIVTMLLIEFCKIGVLTTTNKFLYL